MLRRSQQEGIFWFCSVVSLTRSVKEAFLSPGENPSLLTEYTQLLTG